MKDSLSINLPCTVAIIETGRIDSLAMILPVDSPYTGLMNYQYVVLYVFENSWIFSIFFKKMNYFWISFDNSLFSINTKNTKTIKFENSCKQPKFHSLFYSNEWIFLKFSVHISVSIKNTNNFFSTKYLFF